ncbi:MAG: alpha/beta fold hydrolase [Hyphomicrobiales bacterium]|nr:alpha/beta fold hydrolase [Hyphomicrobiales bacterium]
MAGPREDQSTVMRLGAGEPARNADPHQAGAVAGDRTAGTGPAPDAVEGDLDRQIHAFVARFTGGLSPVALAGAWFDWASHLALSPGRRMELALLAFLEAMKLAHEARPLSNAPEPGNRASPTDRRFRDEAWSMFPFRHYANMFLACESWWDEATGQVHGVTAAHQAMLRFTARQLLDMWSPSNFIPTNPEVLLRLLDTKGASLAEGLQHFKEDLKLFVEDGPPAGSEGFRVGETVGITPGKIVARTSLAEVIQYTPTTPKVHAQPVLIVPAWIMKYYILDLRPDNSLVRHLIDQGFTVFMISWKNPTAADRDTGFDQYRTDGIMAALAAATAVTGAAKVHGVGYCLGGTLLAVTAAAMARDDDDRWQSLTFLAAQTDFHEAGELRLFINESQLALLDDMMHERGFLEGPRMMGTFNLLRSNELIWSRMVREYLMGERRRTIDVMAWASDTTRMPARMHSEYLRSFYLDNDLAEGRFRVGGRPVALQDIKAPVFALGTEWDHVAPWHSVYKIHLSLDTDITFALTNGGHNQGVVSPPGTAGRHYRLGTTHASGHYTDPESWLARHEPLEGSWWTGWTRWLKRHSHGALAPPPTLGNADAGFAVLGDAPGSYVTAPD